MEKLIQIEQVLQIGAKLLQIGAAPVVTNRGNSYCISGQFQLLQLGQNYYKSRQVLQIEAIITNRCRTVIYINIKAFTKFNRKQLNILETFLKYLKNQDDSVLKVV